MTKLEDRYSFRGQIVDRVQRDLVGPRGDERETIQDSPIDSYIVGVLYPEAVDTQDVTEEEDAGSGSEDAYADPPVAASNRRFPSSMGITFAVDVGAGPIAIQPSAARYEPQEPGEGGDEEGSESAGGWLRAPLELPSASFDPSVAGTKIEHFDDDGLELFVRVREPGESGDVSITAVLINRRHPQSWQKDADSYFQVGLTVRGSESNEPFVERRETAPSESDEDLRSYALLFRHARNFAVGHGVSASWADAGESGRSSEVRSDFIPRREVNLAESVMESGPPPVPMALIATGDKVEVLEQMSQLGTDYQSWIDARFTEISDIPGEDLRAVAEGHLNECRTALDRIHGGIALISTDERAWDRIPSRKSGDAEPAGPGGLGVSGQARRGPD